METTEKKPTELKDIIKKLNPDYLKALGIRDLERDEKVIFKLVQKPMIAHDTGGQRKEIYPASKSVPSKEQVWDGKDMHEISIPEDILFLHAEGAQIVVTGKEPHRRPLLWYLRMSNYNRSNPYAIAGKEPIFEEVSYDAINIKEFEKESEIASLITFIKGQSTADLTQITKQLSVSAGDADTSKQMALVAYIKNDANRERFKSLTINGAESLKELVKQAEKLDLIKLDSTTRIWSMIENGNVMGDILQVQIGSDSYDALVKYFVTDPKGKQHKTFYENRVASVLLARKADAVGKGL